MTTFASYTDDELLRLLSGGNQQAFEALYLRHWEALYKSAFFILQEKEACKDVVQDIFIWLWEHRQTLQINSPKAYLRAAVKFKVANYIRSGNVRKNFFEEATKFTPFTLPNSAEQLADAKELNTIIQEAISRLPGKCREIFQLSREEHLTNQEIAARLGISVKTVESQMTIALRRIRTAIEPFLACFLIFFWF